MGFGLTSRMPRPLTCGRLVLLTRGSFHSKMASAALDVGPEGTAAM